tara:strand:+ start:1461 stop:1655 length:195 start_codon:yes stop_codon:yes gene_type:complete
MKTKSKEVLLAKMRRYEEKANDVFDQIKEIEDKERLIGFRTANDNRMSTDGVYMTISKRTYVER